MKQNKATKHGYRSFCAPWKGIRESWQEGRPAGGVLVLWGPDEYLLWKGCRLIRTYWKQASGDQARTVESGDLKGHDPLGPMWQERDLFSGCSLYLLTQAEKLRSLAKNLKDIPAGKMNNILVLVLKGRSLHASVQKELTRLQAVDVPCFPPVAGEMSSFVKHLCGEHKLKLSSAAVATLNEAVGDDLFKTENEIKKLATIFQGQPEEKDSGDIAPYMGLLKEEHAFALSRKICKGERHQAVDLALDLLNRGESAIALTSIISRHIRTALRIKTASGRPAPGSVRLPSFVLREYESYCKTVSPDHLRSKLMAAQKADMQLKGLGRIPDDVILTSLLLDL